MTITSDASSPPAPGGGTESASLTEFTVLKCSHEWTIKNFSYNWMKPSEELASPTRFSAEADDKIKWRLSCYPGGRNEETKDYVSVFLNLEASYKVAIRAKFKFYILNGKREKTRMWESATAEFLQTSDTESQGYGNNKFILRSDVLDKANGLLPDDSLTILCELSASTIVPSPTAPARGEVLLADCWGCTRLDVARISYVWTISNFSYCTEATGVSMSSPLFPADAGSKPIWNLVLFPRGQSETVEGFVSLFLHPGKANASDVRATYKMWIVNAKRERTNLSWSNTPHTFPKGSTDGRGYSKFVARDELLKKATEFLPDGKLVIFCEVAYVAGVTSLAGDTKPAALEMPKSRLADDLRAFLEKTTMSDVTLVVGGKELKAHRAILAARSPVFRELLGKKGEDRVEIGGVGHEVLRELLRFVYTDRVGDIRDMAAALLKAADKFRLERLKVLCEEALCSMLGIENAAGLLVLASEHKATQLRERAVDFVNAHAAEVMADVRFTVLFDSHPELIAELALEHLLALKANEETNERLLFDKEQRVKK